MGAIVYYLPFFALISLFVNGSIVYEHDKDKCAKSDANKKYPFCNWYYLAYTPYIFREGVDEKVLVSTHNVNFDVKVVAKFFDRAKKEVIVESEEKVIKPGVLTELVLKIPLHTIYSGYVEVSGTADVPKGTNGIPEDAKWKFVNKTSVIYVRKSSNQVFMQTDRPIYKPGETIFARVLSVDSSLKALTGVIKKVVLMDPGRTIMKQWRDVPLNDGFASFKFKLSIKPVLGDWQLRATIQGKQSSVLFRVGKYVLPKFQVKIEPPPFIALGQKKVDGQICAKYSYGRDVSGLLKARICIQHPSSWSYINGRYQYRTGKRICDEINKKISGCEPFQMDLMFFDVYKYNSYRRARFIFEASLKEGATGITLKAPTIKKYVERTLVQISFDGTPDVFKPGLPFKAQIIAKYPDGTPVDNIKVKVNVRDSNYDDKFKRTVIVRRGVAKLNLPEVSFDRKKLRFNAYYEREKIPGSVLSDYRRRTTGYHTATAWYSPSHSYLGIIEERGVLKVGSNARIRVQYTTSDTTQKNRTVYYSLMCKGVVALAKSQAVEFKAALKRKEGPDERVDTTPATPATRELKIIATDILPDNSTMETTYSPVTAERTAPPTAPETTAPPTTPPTTTPPFERDIYPYGPHWWRTGEPVTRPPLPKQFSTGSFELNFKVTQEMSPSCRMIVYYIKDQETVADNVVLNIEDSFQNEVSMKFSAVEVFPGTKVNLTLKASPGSRFAISAVDKSVHFLRNANDIKAGRVLGVLKQLDIGTKYISEYSRCGTYYYGSNDFVDSQKAFSDSGMDFLSNMYIDTRPCSDFPDVLPMVVNEQFATAMPIAETTTPPSYHATEASPTESEKRPDPRPKPKPRSEVKVRTEFPETWLWTEEKFDDKTGEKVIQVTVPDTITTWYASGFAVSGQTGLGVANPAEIRGFKALFVSMNLPYSVIRGEIVTLPIVIFNYLSDCLHINVSMKDSVEFRSLTRSHADFCICGEQSATVMFKIIAKKIGRINIEARVDSLPSNTCPKHVAFDPSSYVDIVRRKLLVEPEGVEKEYTYNSLVCPKGTTVADKIKLRVPSFVVPGSVYAELRVVGDIMGPSLSNLDSLLKMPYGCGEQNMLNFAPNIFIMQYLKATGQLSEEIKNKAVGYTLLGYQRELSYKHPDGSYSAFGTVDAQGSMWLTAFVLKSFAQARPFIDIDESILRDAKRWIISKQSPDGCFPSVGKLHNKAMKGGVTSPVTLTGYVIVSLLEADTKPDSLSITKAINKCIRPNLKSVNDSYSIAILAYAMAKAGRSGDFAYLIKELNSKAIREGGMTHWESPKLNTEKKDDWFAPPYYQARSTDIEMTSYALLAFLKHQSKDGALGSLDIVKWLAQQRNSLGGWASTQDTVLAMQSLAEYAALVYGGETDMTIDVSTPGLQRRFNIGSKNNLVLQRVQLPSKFPSILKTFSSGQGCALLSASVKYNAKKIQEVPAFSLTVSLSPVKGKQKLKYGRCRSQELNICAKWKREGDSNMAIISVKMLSGFVPVTKTLEKAVSRDILLKEYEKKGKEWVFYYSKIDDVCLRFTIKQSSIVEGIKPASVSVYDYYDKDLAATSTYEVKSTMCK